MIPAEFRPFVSDAVASGKYRSEEEMVSTALRLLEERERKLDALRKDLQFGLDELDRGEAVLLGDPLAQQAFFDELKAGGRQRLSALHVDDAKPGD
jgi:antitoxin ParD1/3/4